MEAIPIHALARNGVWRSPPWKVPRGRRPSYGRRFLEGFPFFFGIYFTISGTFLVALSSRDLDAISLAYDVIVIVATLVAISYGAVMIVSARRPLIEPRWFFPGLTSTPTAARWYGLAFLAPPAVAWALAYALNATPLDMRRAPVFLFVGFIPALILLAFGGCTLMARRASNRPVKHAIVGGFAPNYVAAPGFELGYWWDGSQWRSFADSAPEGALRSPDRNYWWTGERWLPLPAIPQVSERVPATGAV